ncbi:MAG: glycerophosphodiester phosphodiesterase [Pseudomonadota bacterium]
MSQHCAWPYPRWIAHRGAGKLAPENTLAAFRLGASHGFRMFECDAKLSADGVVFLLHDATLERCTSGSGPSASRDWSELAQLDAGSWHSRAYAGEPLASLANLARYCLRNQYFLNIEIKPSPGAEALTGEVVAHEAALAWRAAPVAPLLTSFQLASLEAAKRAQPQLPRGLLLDEWRENAVADAARLECRAVICNFRLWNEETVRQVQQNGMKALSYTVNDETEAQRLITLGTDGIITDRVDLFAPD